MKDIFKQVPGFRTDSKWKMVLAVIFYIILSISLLNPTGDTLREKVLDTIITLIFYGMPFILISNLGNIRNKLPIFRKKTLMSNILGTFIVFIIMGMSIGLAENFKLTEKKQLEKISTQQSSEKEDAKKTTEDMNNKEKESDDVIVEAEDISENKDSEDDLEDSKALGNTEKEVLLKGVEDYDAGKNLIAAADQINMNIHIAKKITKIEKWAGGDRYSMSYEGNKVIVYMKGDKTVSSINIGDIKVYEDGYESLDVKNYITSSDMDSRVTTMAKDLISRTLNYPDTAKFPWLDWSYARVDNIYIVSSHVEAKNAFGVQSTIPFYIEFKIDNSGTKPVFVVLDGEKVFGESSQIISPEKKSLKVVESEIEENGSFEIKDGILGKYGKKETLGSNENIYHYIPAGKYKVTTTMNNASVLVLKREPYKNSDGYMEHEVVSMNRFDSNTNFMEIFLREDEKVMITIHSSFNFEPID